MNKLSTEARTLKSRIDQYTKARRKKQKEASDLDATRSKLVDEYNELVFGVKVGTIVVYRGSKHRVQEILSMRNEHLDKPWVKGFKQRVDGSYGTALKYLFNEWEVVDEG